MLSSNTLSLFSAILLCLPITLFFTISSYSSTTFTISYRHVTVTVTPPSPPSPIRKLVTKPSYKTLTKYITRNYTAVNAGHTDLNQTLPSGKTLGKNLTTSQINNTLHRNITVVDSRHTGVIKNSSSGKTLERNGKYYYTPTDNENENVTVVDTGHPDINKTIVYINPLPYRVDDKDDVDLLKRASWVNPNPRGPKKIAFLFLTTTPLPFAPIWEMFFNQSSKSKNKNYNIYIHTVPKLLEYNTTPPFTGVFANRIIPNSKPTRRNTPTLISAARRLIAHALLDDPNNHIFTLLSSTCVPLHSFNFTYKILTSKNVSFIEILSNEPTSFGRWVARGEHAMLPEVPFDVFRVGSQFWSLTRSHARVVVEDVKLWRKFRLPCVDIATCYPEENYFPTLLYMVDPRGVVPATLTNVNWRGSYNGHPRVYNGSEVDFGLIQWLRWARPRYGDLGLNGSGLDLNRRSDPFLFARKFDPNCVEPLLSIANDVLFND